MASASKNQIKELNKTLLINKIICCFNWFIFAFALELAAENRQMNKENSPYDEVFRFSYQNFRDFFGPAGFFIEILMGFFESFDKKLGSKQWKKDDKGKDISIWVKSGYFALALFLLIILSYLREKILERYNKNLIAKIFLVGLFSIFLMIFKIYIKSIINSITEDQKQKSFKKKALIASAALAISAICLYLNLLIERNSFFEQNLFFKACLTGILGFLCYSVLVELFIYNIFIEGLCEDWEKSIKEISLLSQLSNEVAKKNDKGSDVKSRDLNKRGKALYIFFLFALNALMLGVLFQIDKIFEKFNFQSGSWAEFGILNLKEILCGLVSFGLIYGANNIGGSIIGFIQDFSTKNSGEIKDNSKSRRNFMIAFVSYVLLAPICLSLNISLGCIILFNMMKTENFFMKCFGCDQKYFPALMTAMFILVSVSTGLLSFVSAEIQNNATLIEENKTLDPSDKKSIFSLDYWVSVCAAKQELPA